MKQNLYLMATSEKWLRRIVLRLVAMGFQWKEGKDYKEYPIFLKSYFLKGKNWFETVNPQDTPKGSWVVKDKGACIYMGQYFTKWQRFKWWIKGV